MLLDSHFCTFFCSRSHSKALWENESYIKLRLVSGHVPDSPSGILFSGSLSGLSKLFRQWDTKTCMPSSCRSGGLIPLFEVRHAVNGQRPPESSTTVPYIWAVFCLGNCSVIHWILHMPGHLHHLQHKTLLSEGGWALGQLMSVHLEQEALLRQKTQETKILAFMSTRTEQSQLVLCPEL